MSASIAEGWLMEDSLPKLVNLLHGIEPRWYQLGLQLGVPSTTLNIIESDYLKTQDCFTRMLKEWLNKSRKPTKEGLVIALRSDALQENRFADQVEKWTLLSSPLQGQQGTSARDDSRSRGPANGRITCILPTIHQFCRHSRKTTLMGFAVLLIWSLLLCFISYRYLELDQPTQSANEQLSPPDLPTLQPIIDLSSLTSEPLIGRENDKQTILNWLEFQTSTVQIVSIVGGPGVGKSALALDVGQTMVWRQATQVYYADMYNSSNRVQPFISKPLEEWLEKVRHPTLLILDNCDHHIHKQKVEFQNLLHSLNRRYIKVLITSQVGITLAFPGHTFEEYHLQKLEKYQAMSLLQRNVEGLNLSTVDYICDLVDNNPLALISITAHLKSKSTCDLQCIIMKLENDPIDLFSSITELQWKYSVVSSIKLAYEYLDSKYQKCGWQIARILGPVDEATLAAHMKPYDSTECLDILTKHSLLEYSKSVFVKRQPKFCVSHQISLEVICESFDSMATIYKLPRLIRYYFLRVSKNIPEQFLSTAPAHVPIATQLKYLWLPKCAPNWQQRQVVLTSYADEMLPIVPRNADRNLHVVVEVGVKAFCWSISNHFYETDMEFAVSSVELLDNTIAKHYIATSDTKGTDEILIRMPERQRVLAAYVYFNRKSLGIKWSNQITHDLCPNPSEAVSIMLKRKQEVEVLHHMTGQNDLALSAYRSFYIDLFTCCMAAPEPTPGCEGVLEYLLKGIVDQAVATSYWFQHVPPCKGSPAVVTSNTFHRLSHYSNKEYFDPKGHLTQAPHHLEEEKMCLEIILKITILEAVIFEKVTVQNHWIRSYKKLECAREDGRYFREKLYKLKRAREIEAQPESNSMTPRDNFLSDIELVYWAYNTSLEILTPIYSSSTLSFIVSECIHTSGLIFVLSVVSFTFLVLLLRKVVPIPKCLLVAIICVSTVIYSINIPVVVMNCRKI